MKNFFKKNFIAIIAVSAFLSFVTAHEVLAAPSLKWFSFGDVTLQAQVDTNFLFGYDKDNDAQRAYTAGTGITLSGGQISATGTGDVNSVESSVSDGEAIVFSGTTGKLIKRYGNTNTGFLYSQNGILNHRVYGGANRLLGVDSAGTNPETKTLATGTSGTDFNIAHTTNTITLNIPDAGATSRGLVTTGSQTFEGQKAFNQTGGGAATSVRLLMNQGTNASAGTPVQNSPIFQTFARIYNTTAAASQNAVWNIIATGVSGNPIQGQLIYQANINGGGAATKFTMADSGNFTATGSLNSVGVNSTGDVKLNTAGNGLYVKEGTNATMGIATLVAGTVTVNTTKVTANSRIFLTIDGGTLTNVGATYVSARTAGTSFTISSTNVLDASNVAWIIIEPS